MAAASAASAATSVTRSGSPLSVIRSHQSPFSSYEQGRIHTAGHVNTVAPGLSRGARPRRNVMKTGSCHSSVVLSQKPRLGCLLPQYRYCRRTKTPIHTAITASSTVCGEMLPAPSLKKGTGIGTAHYGFSQMDGAASTDALLRQSSARIKHKFPVQYGGG